MRAFTRPVIEIYFNEVLGIKNAILPEGVFSSAQKNTSVSKLEKKLRIKWNEKLNWISRNSYFTTELFFHPNIEFNKVLSAMKLSKDLIGWLEYKSSLESHISDYFSEIPIGSYNIILGEDTLIDLGLQDFKTQRGKLFDAMERKWVWTYSLNDMATSTNFKKQGWSDLKNLVNVLEKVKN